MQTTFYQAVEAIAWRLGRDRNPSAPFTSDADRKVAAEMLADIGYPRG